MAAHRGGGRGSGSAAFFASLPADELTPLETGLRQVLLDWLVSLGHQPFPLIEWIDRRVGGEIETRRDEKGQTELLLRGGQPPPGYAGRPPAGNFGPPPGNFGRAPPPGMGAYPPPGYPPPHPGAPLGPPPVAAGRAEGRGKPEVDAATFFKSLPSDSFSRLEEELRDSIFDFLASWKSQALATISDLNKDPTVAKFKERLCKNAHVPLADWIERRIGGEIQLKKEGGASPIIHLSKPAQAIVAEKYKRMEAEKDAPKAAASSDVAAPRAPAGGKGAAEALRAKQLLESMSKEDFFKSLPDDELKEEELALRDAVLEFLDRWPAHRPAPVLGDLGQDPGVAKLRAACMPQKVALRDWVDRRIGGEIELRKDPKGMFEVLLRGAPARAEPARAEPPPGDNDRGGKDRGGKDRGGKDRGRGSDGPKGSRAPPVSIDDFFATLPDDSLTDAEADLRVVVLDFLEARGQDGPVSLGEILKDNAVLSAQSALLPPEVPMRQWINRRIGGEVKIEKDNRGQWVLNKASFDSAPAQGGSDRKEAFFATLPDDSFTPEEEDLRDTLLAFIGSWPNAESPSLSDAGGDTEIRRARPAVLPKGCQVSLKDWIERRIGGEIELAMDPSGSGQWLFGLRGSMVLPAASRGQGSSGMGGAKKRRMG